MFCGKCGNQLQPGNLFCGKCGTKIIYQDSPIEDKNTQPITSPPLDQAQQIPSQKEYQSESQVQIDTQLTANTSSEPDDNNSDKKKNLFILVGIALLIFFIIMFNIDDDTTKKGTLNLPYGIYNGEIAKKQPNGKGTLTFNDNSKLEATFKNGLAEGTARITFPDGTYSEGEYKNGLRQGDWVIIKNNSYYLYYQRYSNDIPLGLERKVVPINATSYQVFNYDGGNYSNRQTISGTTIKSSEAKYIGSEVKFTNSFPKTWRGKIFVKYISPTGRLIDNPQISPSGYSFDMDVSINNSEEVVRFSGWGNKNGYAYPAGDYTIEYYWDNNLIGKTSFTVRD